MAYKCSKCFMWIPREGHSASCPKTTAGFEPTVLSGEAFDALLADLDSED